MKNDSARLRFVGLLGACIALGVTSVPAAAAEEEESSDSVYGRVGLYYAGSDTKIRLDNRADSRPGTEVDFENDLDFSDGSSVVEGDIGLRVSLNLALEFQYLRLNRNSSATLDRSILVDGELFDVDAQVAGGFKSTVYHGRLVWTVADWDGGDFALSLGLHATEFAIQLEGQAALDEDETHFVEIRKKKLAPLPTIGSRLQIDVAQDVKFFLQGEFFTLKVNGTKGSLLDAEAGVAWDFSRNIGIGASWRLLGYDLDVTKNDFKGSVNYSLSGPMVFATFRF